MWSTSKMTPSSERAGEQVRTQQAAAVDGSAPRLADAAGDGDCAWREAAEYVLQHVGVLHVHVDRTCLAVVGGFVRRRRRGS
jgi:hypothetical protein